MKSKYTDAYYKREIKAIQLEIKALELQDEWRKNISTVPKPLKMKIQKLDLLVSKRVVDRDEKVKLLGSAGLANLWFDYFTEHRHYETFYDYQWRVRYVPFANFLSERVTLEDVKRQRIEDIRELAFQQISDSTEYDRLNTIDFYSNLKDEAPAVRAFIEPDVIRSLRHLNSN